MRGVVKIVESGNSNIDLQNAASTGLITLFRTLTPSYLPSAITSTMIGFKLAFTNISSALLAGTAKSVMSVSLTAGVWLLQASIQTPAGGTYQGLSFSTNDNVMNYSTTSVSQISTDATVPTGLNIVFVVSTAVTINYYMVAISGNDRTLTQKNGSATRLA